MIVALTRTLLDEYGGYRPGLARITLTGANQRPRRFIHPPTFEWEPVAGAATYRVAVWSGAVRVHDVTVSEPTATLEPAWIDIPDGLCRLTIYALAAGGELIGV